MEIKRERLAEAIARVVPAVARKELFPQATRLAIHEGHVVAYNDEISIFDALPEAGDISGALDGRKFNDLVSKLKTDVVDLSQDGDHIVVKSGRTTVAFDALPVALPLDEIDKTGEDMALPEGFAAGLALVASACARDLSRPVLTCVRMGGEELEASDGYRAARLRFAGLDLPPVLLPVSVAETIADYPVGGVAVSDGGEWIRFSANDGNTTLHARLFSGKFPDLAGHYATEGDEVVLPEKLSETLVRAGIFASREKRIDEEVGVQLRPRRLTVSASCEEGRFEEKLGWDGTATADFSIHPRFLAMALKAGTSCVIGKGKVKFVGAGFEHVIALR